MALLYWSSEGNIVLQFILQFQLLVTLQMIINTKYNRLINGDALICIKNFSHYIKWLKFASPLSPTAFCTQVSMYQRCFSLIFKNY